MRANLLPAAFALLTAASLPAQTTATPTTAETAATRNSSYIDPQGTAHITRVIPIPDSLSPQAKQRVMRSAPDEAPPQSLADRRAQMEQSAVRSIKLWSALCPNTIVESSIAGVPVHIITPQSMPKANADKVLINLHGGGFNADSGSYSESIPIASYTGIKVVAVLYRLAPEHPFPAALDDTIAVYKELLKTYKPSHIVLYGTSAGATLTGEAAVKIKQLGLPQPAALGLFSTLDSFARIGDSQAIFTLSGLAGHLDPAETGTHDPYYVGATDPKRPRPLAHLRRPPRPPTRSLRHQHARRPAQRHRQPPPRLPSRRHRRRTRRLRSPPPRLLVRLHPARIHRSQPHHGQLLPQTPQKLTPPLHNLAQMRKP